MLPKLAIKQMVHSNSLYWEEANSVESKRMCTFILFFHFVFVFSGFLHSLGTLLLTEAWPDCDFIFDVLPLTLDGKPFCFFRLPSRLSYPPANRGIA